MVPFEVHCFMPGSYQAVASEVTDTMLSLGATEPRGMGVMHFKELGLIHGDSQDNQPQNKLLSGKKAKNKRNPRMSPEKVDQHIKKDLTPSTKF